MTSDVAAPSRDILVVEDDPVVAGLIDHMLRRRGFAVHVVADGRRANELLDTMDPPAVVVLDVMLPYVDGFELIERIRHTPRWEAVPIIMLTSKSQESYVIRAFEAGVSDYVVKPFRPEEFVARVRRLAGSLTMMAGLASTLLILFVLSVSSVAAQVGDASDSTGESTSQAPAPSLPAAPSVDRDLRVQFGVAHESLSGGRDPWRSVTLDLSNTRSGQTLYGSIREASRFSVLDHQFMGGLSHRLSPRLTAVTELEVSPSHTLLAQWAVLGQLVVVLGDGWNVQPSFRHGEYTGASVNMAVVTAERYWGRYRGAYTLYVGHLVGGGVAPSHRVHGDYFYGKYESNVGVSLATGRELENVEFRGVLRTGVRSAAVVGRQWLTPRWFVVYDAVVHEQGIYYTRKRLGLGLGHRF